MSKKGGKPSFPLHKVLGRHISRVRASRVYSESEKNGVLRFVTDLLAGVEDQDVRIKPVTIPGYAAPIGSEYVVFATDLGRPDNDERTTAVKNELIRQGKVAAKKRGAKKKKDAAAVEISAGKVAAHGLVESRSPSSKDERGKQNPQHLGLGWEPQGMPET